MNEIINKFLLTWDKFMPELFSFNWEILLKEVQKD